jgi:outer membrane protein
LSKLAKEKAVLSLQDKENDIAYKVASNFLSILKIKEVLELSRQSVESSKAHLTNVQNKYKVGTVKKTDVLQWEVKLKNDETALSEIENNLNVLLSVWKNLLNTNEDVQPENINIYDYDEDIEIYASINRTQIGSEMEKIIESTKSNNPVLKSLNTTNKMLDKQILMAKGNFLPSLNLQFTYQIENDDEFNFSGDDNWNLVAALSIPIFSGGTNYTNLEKTRSSAKGSKLNLQSARDNIIIGTKNAYYNLVTKAQSVKNNRYALESAKENYKLINNLFEQGMITNSELLDADIMLFAGKMNLVSSYYDFLISKYELKKFTNQN